MTKDIIVLNSEIRTKFNKYQSKIDRDNEKVPAVLYSKEKNIHILLNKKEATKWYSKSFAEYQTVFIQVNDEKFLVFPKKIDTNKLTEEIIHGEFLILKENNKYILEIPVVFDKISESPGAKNKGTLIITRKTLKFLCDVKSIPLSIIFDSINVDINQKIKTSDLIIPKNIVLKEKEQIIATCVGSRLKEEAKPAEEEEVKTETKEETKPAPLK